MKISETSEFQDGKTVFTFLKNENLQKIGDHNIQDYLVEGQNGFWVSTESPGALKESMQVALSQSPESILELKKNCKNALTFDYLNFTEEFVYLLE